MDGKHVVGWREKCCGDQPEQMDPGPCGAQIHAPGLLTRRITLQPYRVHHWFCLFSLFFFVSFFPLCTPPLSSEFSSGTWMKQSSFSIPCLRVHMPTDMDGWVTSDCDSSGALYRQNINLKKRKKRIRDEGGTTEQRIDFTALWAHGERTAHNSMYR